VSGLTQPPVIARLWGRLGNQLFIFAAGYACARRTNGRLLFYDWANTGSASYQLADVLGSAFTLATPRELLSVGQYDYDTAFRGTLSAWASRIADARAARANLPQVIWEERLGSFAALHREVLDARPPVLLVGLFQNESYFSDYADEVSAAIDLPAGVEGAIRHLARPILSVMFRRGDYVDTDWSLPLAYYHNALEYAQEQLAPRSLLLFSDDPQFIELAAPWLQRYGDVHLATEYTSDPLAQLALVTQCDHHIVANSSFSWWGAWLGEHRHDHASVVIAPAGWLRCDGRTIPERWVKMPTTTDQILPWTTALLGGGHGRR
jgi:hypothetical protein